MTGTGVISMHIVLMYGRRPYHDAVVLHLLFTVLQLLQDTNTCTPKFVPCAINF